MKIKQFTDKLLHNWPIKLLCLVVAIFLYIFHQASLVEHKNFVVPLKIIENGQVTHIQQVPDTITISVRALPEDISNIHQSDFEAILDLSTLTDAGEYTIPVIVNIKDKLKELEALEISIKPDPSIKIKVEKKIVKYIPLKASVSGEPAFGYQVESVQLEPSTACVIGPESIVNKITELYTDKVVVNNAEVNFTSEVLYLPVNKFIKVLEPGPFKATVIITPIPSTKVYSDVPVMPFYLAENLLLDGTISTINLSVSGTMPVLENYVPGKSVLQADLSEITEPGEYDVPVSVYLPSYLTLDSLSQETVHVKVISLSETEEKMEAAQE